MATEEPWKGAGKWVSVSKGAPEETQQLGMEDMLRELVRQDLGLSQNIPDNLRNLVRQDLKKSGYSIIGELPTREGLELQKVTRKEEEAARLAATQEGVGEYIESPGFWQQAKDLAMVVMAEQAGMVGKEATSVAAESIVSGLTLRNQEHILNLAGRIGGNPALYKDFKQWQQKGLKKKLGYVPSPEVTAFVEAPTELAAYLVPLSNIFKGASIAAKALTKIPVLQRVARATIGGIFTGLARKPGEEGFLDRLKQVPGDVLFFNVLDLGILSASQIAKIANYNRAAKYYKKINWEAPQVPPDGKPFTPQQMRELFRKMDRNSTGAGIKLTAEEAEIIDTMKETRGWNEAVKRGWLKPQEGWITTGQPSLKPRAPRFADIFRDPSKLPLVEKPVGVPVPPEAAPPPPAPAPGEVRPMPAAEIPPGEVPLARRPPTPGEPPAAMVDITPTAEGGWTIKIPQPTPKAFPGGIQPGPTIPWKPVEPELLPPAKKPPKVIKPRKPLTFKNPFYEAINQLGGVAPNPDYPYSSLKALFPIGLIRKTGMPMDTLAQAMAHEFPSIEGDVDLWDMADNIKRGRAAFKDVRTGDEYLPPVDELEAMDQRLRDREPQEFTKADFNSFVKVAIKDTETGAVHKGRLEENIHADMFIRIENKGVKKEAMEAGFVLPNNQFIFSYALKPKVKGEPFPGPKYDQETFHRQFVKKALDERKYISPEVLEQHKIDYPELFREPVVFKPGDSVEYDTPAGVRTGEITSINEKEGIASIRTEAGVVSSRNIEDLRITEKPPEVVPEEVSRVAEVAEPTPLAPSKEPTLTEIEKVFNEMAIPRIKRGVLADQIIRNYKPEKGPMESYIKSILPKITKEGELWVKPTIKRAIRPARLTPEMEEVIPGRAERPEDIFERAEEEARVHKIFKESTKTGRERDVLDRKILKGQSYDDIGKAHGITRQRAEQIFSESFEKVKDHPDVRAMIMRKMRQANLGPIPSARDLDDFVKFIRRYFTSTKGVDKVVDATNDRRIRSRLAEEFGSSIEGRELKKFLKKNKNDSLDDFVLSALKGEVPIEDTHFPDKIKKVLVTMRDRIDKLSQLVMAHGAQSETTKATFEAGLGEYVGKFYKLHQQRRWDPPKEVKDRFKAMLKREHPDQFGNFTEEELDDFINAEINEERKYGFGTKKERRVPTEHYKKRMLLSPEWRELAGEIRDPVWLYLKTISDQAAMAYNAEFLNKIKQTYPDLWTSDATEAKKLGWQKNQLPKDYGYGELKGMYVNKELYDYIMGELEPGMHAVAKAIQQFITHPFKATKTILSIPTQARNFFTNFSLSFLARNSILNPVNLPHYQKALKVFLGRNTTYKKEWEKLVREGVTEVQYYGTEIPKIQNDLMKLDPIDWGDEIWKTMSKPPKFVIRKLGNIYNFNDALFRISAYYKLTERLGYTPQEAVKEIDISLQNYRKLPTVVDVLRKYPVFGPFVSFQWNMGKIVVNQALEAAKEMGSKGAKTKIKGSLRLSRLLFVIGLPAVMIKTANEVFDIDEKLIKKLKEFLPKWRRQGNFLYFRGKNGQLKALDLTYIWPTGEIEKAIRSLQKGDIEAFKNSIDLLSHPIFDAWSILIEGRQPYWGTKVPGGFPGRMAEIIKLLWVPASAPIPSLKSLTESIKAGKFEPRTGAITTHQIKALIDAWNQEPDRYGSARSLPEEVKGFLTGFKTFNVEPDKLLLQYVRATRFKASELRSQLKSWIANNTKAPAWEIKDKIDDFNKRITKLLEKASEASEFYKELKRGGFLVKKKD